MRDLSMHILDILQNSTRAGATRVDLELAEMEDKNQLLLVCRDNGGGMDAETVKNALNPFFTTKTTRKVGLGLPLLKQNAERTGGTLSIDSQPQKGTVVTAVFGLCHIDRPPLGDLPGVLALTISLNPNVHFVFHYHHSEKDFVLDTDELYQVVAPSELRHPQMIGCLKEMIEENMEQ